MRESCGKRSPAHAAANAGGTERRRFVYLL
jgi:hypothetical protein